MIKRLFAALLLAAGIACADTTTTKLGLTKPSQSSTNWGTKVNNNYDIIDSSVPVLSGNNIYTASNTFNGPVIFGSSVTLSTTSFSRILIATPTYSGSDALAFNGTARTNNSIYACNSSWGNCASLAQSGIAIPNSSSIDFKDSSGNSGAVLSNPYGLGVDYLSIISANGVGINTANSNFYGLSVDGGVTTSSITATSSATLRSLSIPTLLSAGCLATDSDGAVIEGSCSGGGGGSSSLEIMANNLRVSSPTATAKFNGTSNGIGINATTSGSTATLTFSMLPGNTNYIQNPATGTWVNTKGIVASTVTATSISNTQIVVAGTNGLLQGDPLLTWDGGRVIALKLVGSDDLSDPSPLGGTGVAAQVGTGYGAQRARAFYGKTNAGSILSHAVEGDCSASGSPECAAGYFKAQGASATNIGVFASASGGISNTAFRADSGQSIFMGSSTFNGSIVISSGLVASGSEGTNGQVLTSGGAGSIPSWTTVSGGGGGSGGYNLQPATVTVQVPLGIYGSTFSFTGPQQSTVTYGLTVGSLTVSNAAGGNLSLSNDNGASFYQVVGSSSDATVGACAKFSSSWTIVSGDCATGGGGGGGSIGGTINNANQNSLTYYSVAGSSNALSGSSIASVYASSMTLNTSTQTATQVFFDYSASSMTLSSASVSGILNANQLYANRVNVINGALPLYVDSRVYFNDDIVTADQSSFGLQELISNGGKIAVFKSSPSIEHNATYYLPRSTGTAGYVLATTAADNSGVASMYWKQDETGGGGGGGGYALQPATVTIRAPYSIEASSVNFSSNTIMPGTTFYANGSINTSADIRANGLTYLNAFSYLSVATDLPGVLSAPINGYHNSAIAAGDVPVGLFGYNINSGAIAPTTGHGLGVLGYTSDTSASKHQQYGVEGRTLGRGLSTSDYSGLLSVATHAGPYNGILAGIISRTETYASDETTPTSTGTVRSIWIKQPVGSGQTGQTNAIYSESTYPSFLTGNLGIGAGTANTSNQLQINTGGNALQATLIQSGNNANYVFSQWGRAGADATFAVSAGDNQFFTGSAAGDTIIRAEGAANAFRIGAGTDEASLVVNKSSVTFPFAVYMSSSVNVTNVSTITLSGASIEVSTIGLVSNIQFQDTSVMRTSPEYYSTTIDSSTTGTVISSSSLIMPVLANATYYFDCSVVMISSISTIGHGLAVLSPTVTGSTITYNVALPLAADAAAGMWFGWGTSSNDAVTSTSSPDGNLHIAKINGMYKSGPNGSGNLRVMFRSEIGSGLSTMKAGSYCQMLRPLQ